MSKKLQHSARVSLAMVFAVTASVLGSGPALAKPTTYYVSQWRASAADNCTTGQSSATPLLHIDYAITTCANDGDTVYIEAMDDTHFIYDPATTLVVTHKVTIVGTGPNFVLASAVYPAIDAGGNFRVLENQSANTVITNVELDNGGMVDKGGGIWNHPKGAGLTLNGVLVYGNSAEFGGGIYNEGTLAATNSTVSTNTATGANINACTIGGGVTARGGGIYNDGTSGGPGGSLNLSQVAIIANTAASSGCAEGGGIFNDGGSVALTNHSSVTSNNATGNGAGAGGGGITNFSGDVSVTASTVSNNTLQCPVFISQPATACGAGAGIVNLDMLDLTDAIVIGNAPISSVSGPIQGGGVYTSNGSTVTIHKGTTSISGNRTGTFAGAGEGGGIYSYGLIAPVGVVQFNSNSTTHLDSNSAGQCGGAGDFYPKGGGVSLYCNGTLVSFGKGPCPCPF
jgi:fibronectin-binding autotransporter adhesin